MEHLVPFHATLSDFPVEEAGVDFLPIDVGPVQHCYGVACLGWNLLVSHLFWGMSS